MGLRCSPECAGGTWWRIKLPSYQLTDLQHLLSTVLLVSVYCSGWGFKAQQVLGAVRGKDFRHEKTKKKRGSYKGGNIDPHATFSYKFESDGE